MLGWQQIIKRGLDITLGVLGLVVLAVPFMLIALAIKCDSRGPVFFRHTRVGRDGERFVPLKFRTMVEGAIGQGLGTTVSEDDTRLTRVGAFLRRWALDELPQLWNVLRGEMSLVGPRPTFAYQVERYDEFQRRRLEVRPGITGWAQINGRNAISWSERIELDLWYVDHATLWLDVTILLRTLWLAFVVRGDIYGPAGVNQDFR
ncbi:MAG: sugar transferase [Gemmatimonadales bacterium]|jgi:lipopolysaccharide/colanic/teichoic acid biosynthesis glycosyltransferase